MSGGNFTLVKRYFSLDTSHNQIFSRLIESGRSYKESDGLAVAENDIPGDVPPHIHTETEGYDTASQSRDCSLI